QKTMQSCNTSKLSKVSKPVSGFLSLPHTHTHRSHSQTYQALAQIINISFPQNHCKDKHLSHPHTHTPTHTHPSMTWNRSSSSEHSEVIEKCLLVFRTQN